MGPAGLEAPTVLETLPTARYTNAKVVLVGETGTGKTGLALRLAKNTWDTTESTHGMEVHPLSLTQLETTDMAREVWLWDFAGQPDYRLIHQLYMDETALALMVMDPQKDDPFETLGHWEKALNKVVKRPFNKLLVAGRCDRGGMTVSSQKIQQYCNEREYQGFIDTAAKTGEGCKELKDLIQKNIPWDHLPYTATTQLFKSLKDAIIAIKNKGVLIKISLLFQWLTDRLKNLTFSEEELRATVSLLAGQGMIRQLVFPSYFKRDHPELPTHPAVLTTYHFTGPIDEIYATLVVRLYYTGDFAKDQLWKNAADFKTHTNKLAGFMLKKRKDDQAELDVYFDKGVQENTRVSFIKYIHEHLLKRADTVTRQRSYICPRCNTPAANPDVVRKMLDEGRENILCIYCEKRFPLIDSIEQKFASSKFLEKVRAMDQEAERNLDNESKDLVLGGEVSVIVGKAGHIYRDLARYDWGIDAEIEFKEGTGKQRKATGRKLYLQLKSGDSYLYTRKRDGKEIFTIKKERWAEYWVSQAYPVMLVIRTSDKKIRWMNVTEYLETPGVDTKQVEFDGEDFTVASLRRLEKMR